MILNLDTLEHKHIESLRKEPLLNLVQHCENIHIAPVCHLPLHSGERPVLGLV